MRYLFTLLLLSALSYSSVNAQAPHLIPYQAVARTSTGNLIISQTVTVRFSIRDDNANGTIVYREQHTTTTNSLGLFNVNIGAGTPVNGLMSNINWRIGYKFLQVELDPAGGTSFINMGTSQFMTVPYALYAKSTDYQGKTHLILAGNISDQQAVALVDRHAGPNTQFVKITTAENLTTVDLNKVTDLISLEIHSNMILSNVVMDNIKYIDENLSIQSNYMLTKISLPALQSLFYDTHLHDNFVIKSIDLRNLTHANHLYLGNNPELISIDLRSLPEVAFNTNLDLSGNTVLSTVNLNSLAVIHGAIMMTSSGLSNFNISNVTTISPNAYLYIQFNNILQSISLNSLNSVGDNSSLLFSGNNFPTSTVNSILTKLASCPAFTGVTIDLSGQNPAAPPSGGGINAKNLLIANGNTVITD